MTRLHEIVLQYNVLYCGWKGVQEAKLYRNTKLYCDRKVRQLGRAGRAAVGARARWALSRGRWGTQGGSRACVRTDAQASARARQASDSWAQVHAGGSGARGARDERGRARPERWVRGRACYGLALGCALGALGLFSI